jgi:hypothetical protein
VSQIVRREIRDTGIRDRWHKPITQLVQLTTFPVGAKGIALLLSGCQSDLAPAKRIPYRAALIAKGDADLCVTSR